MPGESSISLLRSSSMPDTFKMAPRAHCLSSTVLPDAATVLSEGKQGESKMALQQSIADGEICLASCALLVQSEAKQNLVKQQRGADQSPNIKNSSGARECTLSSYAAGQLPASGFVYKHILIFTRPPHPSR